MAINHISRQSHYENGGTLYIVATPIGNMEDISPRALDVLSSVDIVAAEDTRHSKKLLNLHNISSTLLPCHDFNEEKQVFSFIKKLSEGQNIALISDAGTPLISDPGYRLVKTAHESGIRVVPLPGACAVITALSASGLPSDKFIFEGFLPAKHKARMDCLQQLSLEERTLIFYEAPHRIIDCLEDMCLAFGEDRQITLARELTKKFESICLDTLSSVLEWVKEDKDQQKGEMVIVVSGYKKKKNQILTAKEISILNVLLAELSLSQAASIGAKILGVNKKILYDYGLSEKNYVSE